VRTLKTVLIFFVSGLCAGSLFGWLISTPRLTSFWFRKGDKFLIPTFRYYLGIGLFLLLGLTLAYSFSCMRGWVARPTTKTLFKQSSAAVVVATSAFLIFAGMTLVGAPFSDDLEIRYLLAIVGFVLLISTACWILTSTLYYPGVLAFLLTIPVAIALLYLLAKVLTIPGEWSEMVTYLILDSLLAAACGFWIARSNPPQGLIAD